MAEKDVNFIVRWLWEETTKPMLIVLACTLFLMFAVFVITGPMFGIAFLVDHYSHWMFLLYIPWFITLPIALKPLDMILCSSCRS